MIIAACTAAGSTTTVQGPDGTSGGTTPVFPPGQDDGTTTMTDGGTTTSPSDYTALFGPPASTKTTANSLNGLWAGTDRGERDTRMVFSASSVVIAKRCHTSSSDATGITVTSLVSASSIKTLESKMATGSDAVTCDLSVKPAQVARCTSATDSDAQLEASSYTGGCFFLSGTSLDFYGTFDGWKLTKLSD
jgi:hypothetical protein